MGTSGEKVFDAIIEREGKFTFVAIPFSPAEAWGAKPRYHVTGTINDFPVRGTLGVLGQDYFLRLGAAWMRDSATEIGASVRVRLGLEGPQEENLAPDIVQALTENAHAKEFFDSLPTFYRKNYIRWIESAKRQETRARRVAEMLALLNESKREK
ncbi:MAG: YdeI/OmpD-associated family protein [Anaerolineae bacterium]|nr:YdeI/OmpD-associated family protein [Anaerolineae bacterium]